MLLQNLINGRSDADIILLEDSIEATGKVYLLCFLKALLQRVSQVHIICLEIGVYETLQTRTEFANDSKLRIHRPPLTDFVDFSAFFEGNFNFEGNFAIVIDGLSTLLLHYDAKTVINNFILRAFRAKCPAGGKLTKFIGLVHSDVTENNFVQELEYISRGIVKISPSDENKFPLQSSVYCIYKSISGKVKCEVQDYKITIDPLDISAIPKPQAQTQPRDPTSHQIKTLTSQLPFALGLREEEMRTRSQLVLPYTRVVDNPESEELFQPYDEEDPDGDLEV